MTLRICLIALLASFHLAAADLSTVAAQADLVAIAVVEQVDYEKIRDFPSAGSGYLKILIPYKGDLENGDWIEVKEAGLGDEKCYYPEPDPFAFEGTRFLVALKKAAPDSVDTFNGTMPGCAIPVLVTSDNRYMVRFPVKGLDIPAELAEEVEFQDPAAIVDATDFTRPQVAELRDDYFAELIPTGPYEPDYQRYRYTRGVPLAEIRKLMFPVGD